MRQSTPLNNQIVDGIASDYALKIEPNGLLTIKNLKVINSDFVAKINQLINQVNLLQQSIGTTEQDINDIKNDIDAINQELSRQTHFRGYYLLNTDIQNLPNSANGDFSFSAESGTVWMYDADWCNSVDIVPDQVTPASNATPLSDGTATAGISTEYSRGDHVHPINVTTTIPISDSASGSVGTTNYYARNDHSYPLNISTSISPQDSASGQVGTTNFFARSDHSHPINVETNASNIPVVNGDATKFIKAGELATEVVSANGDTTTIDNKLSRTYNGSGGGWIRLCVFPAGASVGNPFIEFKIYSQYNAVQIIRLVSYYTVNGINTVYGIFTAPTRISANYAIDSVQNYVLNAGSSSSFAGVKCGAIQINSTDGDCDEGLRIARSINGNFSGIFLGCDPNSSSGTISNQWNIVNTPDGELRIGVNTQIVQDTQGLVISADGNTLYFNGSVIAGTGATNGASNGSVNYSADNPILWGGNSVDTNGGFYSNGPKIYWRDHALQIDPYHPG
ncbi:MAG: hypothetical protein EZS28_005078 [Streblomastix strix]|uniref:Uncharacterized protein n=1 Tax=Streblomastix strix TaxID=222440 RepID=A0A5J4WXU7_9EUKA|nr:MAG: hypothetical protein EZS28_005078 [Streblomastix strix]